jgi:succinate-semialdehyde dehydrogenase/glutarate-semialdehyde dehydrogenase
MAIAIINPATGKLEQEFAAHTSTEVADRIAQAQAAFEALRDTSYEERGTWMRRAAELMESEVEQSSRMLVVEMGKPIAQARAEVLKCARSMRFYAQHAERFLADEPLPDPSAVGATKAYTRYEPLGVVLAVMPWNYPLWQVIRFAAPALMAGNTGLLKHASNVPASARYLDAIFGRAGFPAGSFSTLLIGSGAVGEVIRDTRVKAVTLTGSEGAGRAVAAAAGAEIKKSVMELGGSDPFIVMPSADLEAAATTAVRARVLNNGQSCIAGKRFIAHSDIYEEFASLFSAKMAALKVGDPLDESVELGPLATAAGRDELAELVDDAVARGATLLTGGHALERDGWYYAATVLADLNDTMRIVREEAFGPVAALYRAQTPDEAIRLANQTSFGLSSAVWTNDPDEEANFVANLDAGAVFINGMSASYPELPFGGIKASGFGRELAAAGIREFTNLKTVWKG